MMEREISRCSWLFNRRAFDSGEARAQDLTDLTFDIRKLPTPIHPLSSVASPL
jgi:hypothetical protein